MNREDKLRKRIKRILEKDKYVTRVDEKCSSIEFGVDLIFERKDVFNVPRLYGLLITTKNIKVTKHKRNSENIKDIIAKSIIAFGHEFPPTGKYLDAIYVLTNKEINVHAQEYLKATRVGFREIHFIDQQVLNQFLLEGKAKEEIFKEV